MSIPKVTGQSSGHRPPWMENTLLSINLVKEEHLFKGCKHEKDKRFLRSIQRAAIVAVWSLVSNRSRTETWEHIRPQETQHILMNDSHKLTDVQHIVRWGSKKCDQKSTEGSWKDGSGMNQSTFIPKTCFSDVRFTLIVEVSFPVFGWMELLC